MSIVMFSGIIAFITSFIGLLPQIIKSLKTRSTQDLSMIMLINYLICSVAWIIYGSSTNSFFVISSNIVGLIVSLLLILLKRHYDARCN
ncbi:SemiSWEET family transporter [Fluoribacter dumoffii]|uniref:SemiSWEET family sugar transporter n=1 Tax=Fluoribacter dumoffii TaxID=463 RepID=UPI00026C7B53|nr:SemiSWEET family transporter [Fluoribacter dumoffii]KTC91125.1 PQ loop repeat protein [Fluoribacter dumoffii NY 23]MCW8387707.1 SemiSWEET family transporter [Fluoribacter dumoffii]MCW8416734.1 SemiSWEET family transporter [Fluoribacter dumoffii]MCW8455426.1 SemiSWEET family transporter [Fluoribacter dumoffii]MCW8460496.1 SemiSWEET family transporter [Fluoribacter dumoffii]